MRTVINLVAVITLMLLTPTGCAARESTQESSQALDPLPAWNDTSAAAHITDFVRRVSTPGSADFVPESDRVAVFDNDGTLWPEAPVPVQLAYALDEAKRLAAADPAVAIDPMVRAALHGDAAALLAGDGQNGLMRILGLSHVGMTTDEFSDRVSAWLATARHPRFGRPYDQLTYEPQQQLLKYLRANGFRTYIVSGGGADFMRVFSDRVYGIPPEQVVGSTATVRFEMRDGKPVLVKTADYVFVNDKDGKPAGIHEFIARRPILAVGNSDGDQAMLEYTTIGNPRPSLGVLIHHTDADREYAYDAHPSSSGKLVTALQESGTAGGTVVDMRADWNTVFTPQS
jgi:phosphoglycolate phosphatase-like HAD superfamily hydrolase